MAEQAKCEARVRRGGYFSRNSEACGKPAKGTRLMIDHTSAEYRDVKRPACGIHLRASYCPWIGPSNV